MNADLDALTTELYATIDDILIANPDLVPERPKVAIASEQGPKQVDLVRVRRTELQVDRQVMEVAAIHLELCDKRHEQRALQLPSATRTTAGAASRIGVDLVRAH
jgi:hypothetical protein